MGGMPRLTVKLYTRLKDHAGTDRIEVVAPDVAAGLQALREVVNEETRDALFRDDGALQGCFTLCLNTLMLDPRKFGETKVQEGDTLHIMPPIAGGTTGQCALGH